MVYLYRYIRVNPLVVVGSLLGVLGVYTTCLKLRNYRLINI